jgi:hypothetical protein
MKFSPTEALLDRLLQEATKNYLRDVVAEFLKKHPEAKK